MSTAQNENLAAADGAERRSVESQSTGHDRRSSSHETHHSGMSGRDSSRHSNEVDATAEDELRRYSTHHSLGPDTPLENTTSIVAVPDEWYDRFTPRRKHMIVALLSFSSLLAPISSTSVLAATPEVADEYNTTGSMINLVNALYMLFMGISPVFWGPLSEVYGRRNITVATGVGFLAASIGTAASPNLASFTIFRILTAFEGTSYLLTGSAIISDIYRPVQRGTATGWFMSGTLIGPAFGPLIGGIIVTYVSWRVIFWLQTGLAGVALIGAWFLVPETIYHKKADDLVGYSGKQKATVLWKMINPWRIIRLYEYPNLFLIGLSSSSLVWNMYSLLTPIRYVINPRYNLTTPLESGLFYLAPGAGYLVGTFMGGRYADYVVKKYIKKRGKRIPEDRVISAVPFMAVIAVCILIYGWCLEMNAGGIPVTVIVMFIQGVAQLFCFPSLNSYCLDVMPGRSGEVIAGNYAIRYMFAFIGMSVVLPAIESIGIGWFSTISTLFILSTVGGTLLTIRYGRGWREKVDERKRRQAKKMMAERTGQHDVEDHSGSQSSTPREGENDSPSPAAAPSAPVTAVIAPANDQKDPLERDLEKQDFGPKSQTQNQNPTGADLPRSKEEV